MSPAETLARSIPPDSIGHVPAAPRWEFDSAVADCFDDMLARSIPQHGVMRDACHEIGRRFVQPGTTIVDLGCSRGAALARFVEEFGTTNRFLGIDVSEPMLDASRRRFAPEIARGTVEIRNFDLREGYPLVSASLTLAVLTVQFTPIEFRQQILHHIYQSTVSGGALILVEKILGSCHEIDDLQNRLYWQLKEQNGYDQDHIRRKALALQGVLVPVTAKWNADLLHAAGFRHVDCFWRWHNFAGWLAIRD